MKSLVPKCVVLQLCLEMPSDLWGAMSGSRVEGGGRLSVRASMPFLGSLFQQASEAKENGAGCSCLDSQMME